MVRRSAVRPLGGVIALAVSATVVGIACSGPHHPPPLFDLTDQDSGRVETDPGANFDVAFDSAINCSQDAGGICACKEVGQKPTSLYLVLDRSGSMEEPVTNSKTAKWTAVREALVGESGVLRKMGGRVRVGATRFPGGSGSGCTFGSEILVPQIGSTKLWDALQFALRNETPYGGTPTAATLLALRARLRGLPSPVYVLLATDGGPNCGTTPCVADECIHNIQHETIGGVKCEGSTNCCDPAKYPSFGSWAECLDTAATVDAIKLLGKDGVKVIVLGVPSSGTDLYAKDLDALAVAGGLAREEPPRYYAPSDPASFTKALDAIAAKVLDTCTLTLEAPVADPGVTNVLLDNDLIPQDAVDGWSWVDDTHAAIRLNGKSCARASTAASQLQVAVGCKTVTR